MSSTTEHESLRELAYQESDALEVTLFWHERSDRLAVSVPDSKDGAFFAIDAARGKALDVFDHPSSYTASRTAPRASRLLAAGDGALPPHRVRVERPPNRGRRPPGPAFPAAAAQELTPPPAELTDNPKERDDQ